VDVNHKKKKQNVCLPTILSVNIDDQLIESLSGRLIATATQKLDLCGQAFRSVAGRRGLLLSKHVHFNYS